MAAPAVAGQPSTQPNARERAAARRKEVDTERVSEIDYKVDFKPSQSQPFGLREIELHTYYSQKAIGRAYERAMLALYVLCVTLRVIGRGKDIAALAEKRALEKIDEIYQQLEAEIDRLVEQRTEARAGSANVIFQGHTRPRKYRVKFYTPITLRYLALIEKLDEVVRIVDELCILGAMDEGQRMNLGHKWAGRVQHLALVLDRMQVNARRSIYRANQQEEAQREHDKTINEIHLDSTRTADEPAPMSSEDEIKVNAELDEGIGDADEGTDEGVDSGLGAVEDITSEEDGAPAATKAKPRAKKA